MQSMGPCADSLGMTTVTVYSIAVGQIPAMFIALIHSPPVHVDLFSTSAKVVPDPSTNGTAINLKDPTNVHYIHSFNISMAFLLVSGLLSFFVLMTLYIRDKGAAGCTSAEIGYEDYINTNMELATNPTICMWNNVFICIIVIFHGAVAAVACSPTSMHFLLLIILLVYVSMSGILQPRVQVDQSAGPGAASSVASYYMLLVCEFCVAMAYVCSNIPYDPYSYKVQLAGLVCFLDMFLLIMGHTWDPVPNMHTILNCRLMYACTIIVLNVCLYVIWGSALRVKYINA